MRHLKHYINGFKHSTLCNIQSLTSDSKTISVLVQKIKFIEKKRNQIKNTHHHEIFRSCSFGGRYGKLYFIFNFSIFKFKFFPVCLWMLHFTILYSIISFIFLFGIFDIGFCRGWMEDSNCWKYCCLPSGVCYIVINSRRQSQRI